MRDDKGVSSTNTDVVYRVSFPTLLHVALQADTNIHGPMCALDVLVQIYTHATLSSYKLKLVHTVTA